MAAMLVRFNRTFAAAHRVWNDPGKCSNIHGHNYDVVVEITVDALNEQNFVTPFEAVKNVVDSFDHVLILDQADPLLSGELFLNAIGSLRIHAVPGVPSTEFMAQLLADDIAEAVLEANEQARHTTVSLSLRETAGIEAAASASRRRTPK